MKVLYGRSSHHQIEALFKAFARALRYACSRDARLAKDAAEHQGAAVIALIDYGAGNLTSVRKGFAAAGAELYTPRLARELERASRHRRPRRRPFQRHRRRSTREWRAAIRESLDRGVPLFGICLGLQWLFDGSEEDSGRAGPRRHRRPVPPAARRR